MFPKYIARSARIGPRRRDRGPEGAVEELGHGTGVDDQPRHRRQIERADDRRLPLGQERERGGRGLGVRVQQQQEGVEEALRALGEQPREARLPHPRFAVSAVARGIPDHRALEADREPVERRQRDGHRRRVELPDVTEPQRAARRRLEHQVLHDARSALLHERQRDTRARRVGVGDRDLGREERSRAALGQVLGHAVGGHGERVGGDVALRVRGRHRDDVHARQYRDDRNHPARGAAGGAAAAAIAGPRDDGALGGRADERNEVRARRQRRVGGRRGNRDGRRRRRPCTHSRSTRHCPPRRMR